MKFRSFVSLAAVVSSVLVLMTSLARADFPFTPDTSVVGSLCTNNDSDFAEYRYPEQVPYCRRNLSSSEKRKIYEAYGIPEHCRSEYTIDHFIPLSLGGTNRMNNLWPEAKSIKKLRQNLELELFQRLKSGAITQAEAVAAIRDAKFNPPIHDPSSMSFCL